MDQKNKIKDEITTSAVLESIMQAYQENAIQQINFSRNTVLASREFTQELAEVFFNVKTSYENILLELIKKGKNRQTLSGRAHNDKDVIVLVTANNKLYGEIIPKVNRLFAQEVRKSNAEIVIIGRQGKDFIDQLELNKEYKYFDVPDSGFTPTLIKPAIDYLFAYKKVTMFYGKFNNIISQDAIEEDLTSNVDIDLKYTDQKVDFLFEPSLEEVLNFFETQIFSLMFDQKLHEARLARYASRIVSMESSQKNIVDRLKKLHSRQKRLREMELNKKQLQLLSGKSLWGTK